jgi:hypothetical protein
VEETYFDKLMDHFREYARDFAKTNSRPPVLIIDNVNHLADNNPKLLDGLQDLAKNAADNGEFYTVFVTSEGKATRQMLGE